MDSYAARVANMLAGNETSACVLEMHYHGPQILFEQNALIAITGADFSPMLNDELLPLWQPVVVRKSTILHFPAHRHGSFAYLAVHGGFTSLAVNERRGGPPAIGEGCKMEKNQELQFGETDLYIGGMIGSGHDMQPLPWKASNRNIYCHPHEIFMIRGRDYDLLTDMSQQELEERSFSLHPSSGRGGYHLQGASLELKEPRELMPAAADFGAICLLPDGHLQVMMADRPLADHLPRIGQVVNAHLPKLAQMAPCENFRLQLVDRYCAEKLSSAHRQELTILRQACHDHLHELTC